MGGKKDINMKYWIVPSNNNKFRLADFLANYGYVDWKQKNKFNVGDTVFIYCTKPESRIRFIMEVEKTVITFEESTKDEEYWNDPEEFKAGVITNRYCRFRLIDEVCSDKLSLDNLKEHGLNGVPQGSLIPSESLVDYIMDVFETATINEPELIEGASHQVYTTRYERNPVARNKCIELKGCKCSICGIDFEKTYGEIGKGFIHVHHIVPVSEIRESYRVDYEKDLIPVCPNCHAMLHRKGGSVEGLKEIINNK